jgi:hypothetical protein
MSKNHSGNCSSATRCGGRRQNEQSTRDHEIEFFSGDAFEEIGFSIIRRLCVGSERSKDRRFTSHFGLKPELVSIVWRELVISGYLRHAGRKPKPEHLLWCLLFLNNYNIVELNSSLVGACEKTFREKAWLYAEGIAKLDATFVRR